MTRDDFEARAREGEILARSAGDSVADARLLNLLLDPLDTIVTYRTALALLARRDGVGIDLLLRAEVEAKADTSRWIGEAFATFRASSWGGDDEFLRCSLRTHKGAPGSELDAAVEELIAWLNL